MPHLKPKDLSIYYVYFKLNFVYTNTMERKFDAKIRKVGNSYVVTVPSNIIERFKLKENQFLTVNVEFEDGKTKKK